MRTEHTGDRSETVAERTEQFSRFCFPIYRTDQLPDDPDAVLLPILDRTGGHRLDDSYLTQVIPAVPLMPEQPAMGDNELGKYHPFCEARAKAIGLLLGAGMAVGVVLGFIGAVVLFALAVS